MPGRLISTSPHQEEREWPQNLNSQHYDKRLDLLRYIPAGGHVWDLHRLLIDVSILAHAKSSLQMKHIGLVDSTPQSKPIFRLAHEISSVLCWVRARRSVWIADHYHCIAEFTTKIGDGLLQYKHPC